MPKCQWSLYYIYIIYHKAAVALSFLNSTEKVKTNKIASYFYGPGMQTGWSGYPVWTLTLKYKYVWQLILYFLWPIVYRVVIKLVYECSKSCLLGWQYQVRWHHQQWIYWREVANSFLKILLNQMVDNTMITAVKENKSMNLKLRE